jgi:hypothetical protein
VGLNVGHAVPPVDVRPESLQQRVSGLLAA